MIPHAPYYGTHDAPALYCLTLWNAWRWTGDDSLLDAHLETAERALHWCDELGDRDGDGLQEYATRSQLGYYNQSWKDAADAILDPTGGPAKLPIATIELQGYLYAARLAMAELYEHVGNDAEAAATAGFGDGRCAVSSRSAIGSRTRASTRSRSTATRNRYGRSVPTLATCCGAACRARTMPAGRPSD